MTEDTLGDPEDRKRSTEAPAAERERAEGEIRQAGRVAVIQQLTSPPTVKL